MRLKSGVAKVRSLIFKAENQIKFILKTTRQTLAIMAKPYGRGGLTDGITDEPWEGRSVNNPSKY